MTSTILSSGIAVFAMLFGAGNLVYPLALGRVTGSMIGYALIGFFITAIMVPLIGLLAAVLFDGDYNKFFERVGKWAGRAIVFVCMIFLGVGIARIITVSHGAVSDLLHGISLPIYTLGTCLVIFAATIRRAKIVDLLGFVLGPAKLLMIFAVIVKGLMTAKTLAPSQLSALQASFEGFATGYLTLDLIGTVFFSGVIVMGIKAAEGARLTSNRLAIIGSLAGLLGGLLLGLAYLGLSLVAAKHADVLCHLETTKILPAIACLALGEHASVFVDITIAIACLTTAIVLTSVVADYLQTQGITLVKEVANFSWQPSYVQSLVMILVAVFAMAILGFDQLQGKMIPVVKVLYPILLVASCCNIAYKLAGFRPITIPVLITFIGSLLISFVPVL